jgi:selenocysteine lyase/cysteine desulfurase
MMALQAYERELAVYLIDMLKRVPGTTIYGITDPARYDQRVPTVSFTLKGHTPPLIADFLGQHHIQVWDGNNYALEIMKAIGHEQYGLVRVGPVHYNTFAEVDRLETALMKLVD